MSTGALPTELTWRKLVDNATVLTGSVATNAFPRLSEWLASDSGQLALRLSFSRDEAGSAFVMMEYSGSVQIECQACLEPFSYRVEGASQTYLVNSETAFEALDQDVDGYLCRSEIISLADLLEDVVITGLPMVPRHPDGECHFDRQVEKDDTESAGTDGETWRPFADLAKQMKQNRQE